MTYNQLLKKYGAKELAESFMIPQKLSKAQMYEADKQLNAAMIKARKKFPRKENLYLFLVRLKYKMQDYCLGKTKTEPLASFGKFLAEYIKVVGKKNKDFAADINLTEVEMSQLLNKHRDPSEKILIRLELHSGNRIPALLWYKVVKKEREYELQNNIALRKRESKFVKNRVKVAA